MFAHSYSLSLGLESLFFFCFIIAAFLLIMTAYKVITTEEEQGLLGTADPRCHTTSSTWSVTPGNVVLSFLCLFYPLGFRGAFVQTQNLHVFPQAISLLGSLGHH